MNATSMEQLVWQQWGIAERVVKTHEDLRKRFVAEMLKQFTDAVSEQTQRDASGIYADVFALASGRAVQGKFFWRKLMHEGQDQIGLGSILAEIQNNDGELSVEVCYSLPQARILNRDLKGWKEWLTARAKSDNEGGPGEQDFAAAANDRNTVTRRRIKGHTSVSGNVPIEDTAKAVQDAIECFRVMVKWLSDEVETASGNS